MKTLDAQRNVVDYTHEHNAKRIRAVAHLVSIEDDPKLNAIGYRKKGAVGRPQDPLSKGWYERDLDDAQKLARAAATDGKPYSAAKVIGAGAKMMRGNLSRYFRSTTRSPASNNMWTVYKPYQAHLAGRGYSGSASAPCFVTCNARAMNDYNHKTVLAYCVAINYDPIIRGYFHRRGVAVSNEWHALSGMVQWIFRSAIRREQEAGGPLPIHVYIPSQRMRDLFRAYLRGELPEPAKLSDGEDFEEIEAAA
jgi:hypothetical protein